MTEQPRGRVIVWPVQAFVLASIGALAWISRAPQAPPSEIEGLARRFSLEAEAVPANPLPEGGVIHAVNKTAEYQKYYMYQVGASAALGDLDGDGLPNDLCLVDIRSKTVVLRPAPGTGARYAPFTLELGDRVNLATAMPALCRVTDLNEDGLADLFIGVYGRTPLLLLRRDPGDLAPGAPLSMASYAVRDLVAEPERAWWTPTATFADMDGDGHLDIVMANYFADGAKVMDGQSEERFEMNDSFSRARNGGVNRIFLYVESSSGSDPSVRYVEAPDPFPDLGARAWTLAIGAADLDLDGLQDLYLANDHGADQLLWNRSKPGALRFEELRGEGGLFVPLSMSMGHDSFHGMGVDFADLNGDGLPDIYVSNIASEFGLQETHFLWMSTGALDGLAEGVAPYVDQGEDLGVAHSAWAWETRIEDLDNDGEPELLQATGFMKGEANRWADLSQLGMGNDVFVKDLRSWPVLREGSEVDGHDPNPIWARRQDGRYADLSEALLPGLGANTRGIASADVDGDGDPDLMYANLWEDSIFIKNNSSGGAFLGLHLLLPVAGAPQSLVVHDGAPGWREGVPAVGARVSLTEPGGRARVAEVDGGNGHSSARAPDLIFGLGEADPATPLPVRVRWRDRDGAIHETALSLAPGWHTVVLGPEAAEVTP